MIAILSLSVPLIAAIILGLKAGRSDPQSPAEFGVTAAWSIAWGLCITFLWQALWTSAWFPAPWYDTVKTALVWTLGTATIWLPVLMITFVLRAIKERRG